MTHRRLSLAAVSALALLALLPVAWTDGEPAKPGAAEPPLVIEVHIGGKAYAGELGKPIKVKVGDQDVELKVTAKPYRVFNTAGVQFQYPAGHAWDADLTDKEVSIWTLDGSDNVLMLFEYHALDDTQAATLLDNLKDNTVSSYGAKNVTTTKTTITLAGKKYPGWRLDAKVAGELLRQDIFTMTVGKRHLALIIQDSTGEGGKMTAETAAATQMLQNSFKLTGKLP